MVGNPEDMFSRDEARIGSPCEPNGSNELKINEETQMNRRSPIITPFA